MIPRLIGFASQSTYFFFSVQRNRNNKPFCVQFRGKVMKSIQAFSIFLVLYTTYAENIQSIQRPFITSILPPDVNSFVVVHRLPLLVNEIEMEKVRHCFEREAVDRNINLEQVPSLFHPSSLFLLWFNSRPPHFGVTTALFYFVPPLTSHHFLLILYC